MKEQSQKHFQPEDIYKLISKCATEKFFGSLELKFESGHLIFIRRTETLKPSDPCTCGSNPGEVNAKKEEH